MDVFSPERILYQVLLAVNKHNATPESVVSYEDIEKLINLFIDFSKDEPILLELKSHIHVVGDIHGSIYDLLRIFEKEGYPPQEQYLFLGDYIDRGHNSIEVLLVLFCLKCCFPSCIFLLRGNHELEHVSFFYGFFDEINAKYRPSLFYKFHAAFKLMPIAATIGSKIFCVHGGIGPDLQDISIFRILRKPEKIEDDEIFTDMLWSDPKDNCGGFQQNSRGCGKFFDQHVLHKFLISNGLEVMIRSHELCAYGYSFPFKESNECITIFSNTDYCGRKNYSSIINVSDDLVLNTTTFKSLTDEEKANKKVTIPQFVLTKIIKDTISRDFVAHPSDTSYLTDVFSSFESNCIYQEKMLVNQ